MLKNFREYIKLYIKSKKCLIEKPLKLRGVEYISLGTNIKIRKNYRIECIDKFSGVELYPRFNVGNNVIFNYNFTAFITDELSIGDDTIIASNVLITTENHGINLESKLSFARQPLDSKPIKIGKNVWIGQNSIILPGVTIGDNVVIGAGSVVTKDIYSNCIVAGNPAKILKRYNYESHKWEKHIRTNY